jgi:hypothetical protein
LTGHGRIGIQEVSVSLVLIPRTNTSCLLNIYNTFNSKREVNIRLEFGFLRRKIMAFFVCHVIVFDGKTTRGSTNIYVYS